MADFNSGFIAQTLAAKFEHISAVDPSSKMVEVGLQPPSGNQVDYSVGFAEDLSHIEDGSVDLITAGQAAHWFDFPRVWQELGRVLSDKGTVAFWVSLSIVLAKDVREAEFCFDGFESYDRATEVSLSFRESRAEMSN